MKRILLSALPLLLLLCTFLPTGSASAKTTLPAQPAYSCGGTTHCYGDVIFLRNSWVYMGAQTNDSVRGIGGGNGFLTNEIWLADTITYAPNFYWVEAGYVQPPNILYNHDAGCNTTNEAFFWADWRPNYGFHAHCPEIVGSLDYGYNVQDTIWQDANTLTTFHVRITPHYSPQMNETSTSNAIYPNSIKFGEELYGTSGASGPLTEFTHNQYMDRLAHWYYWNGYDSYTPESANPPKAYWNQYPSQDSTGGRLYACTSGC